jgi:hypothetical protein
MDANRIAHLKQLSGDINRWKLEAERLEAVGQKSRAEAMRKWAKSAERLAERIKVLPPKLIDTDND